MLHLDAIIMISSLIKIVLSHTNSSHKENLSPNPTKIQNYAIKTDSKQICSYSIKEQIFTTTTFLNTQHW